MCDATHMTVTAEPLPTPAYTTPPPCDGCPWPLGSVLCYSPEAGCFVLCQRCADQLARQTLVACLLQAALHRSVRLI